MANSAGAVILIGTVESEGISSEVLAHPFTDEDELGYRQIVGPQAPRGGDLTPVGSRDRDCLAVAVLARRRAPLAFDVRVDEFRSLVTRDDLWLVLTAVPTSLVTVFQLWRQRCGGYA